MAREGADVTIAHLPEEQEDAEDTKKMVEAENRSCFLFAGDLTNYENCRRAVDEHFRRYEDVWTSHTDAHQNMYLLQG